MLRRSFPFGFVVLVIVALLSGARARAQIGSLPVAQPATQPVTQPQPPQAAPLPDGLGRDTPRGTVLGFLDASRAERDDVSPQYLNTGLRDDAAVTLAHQLFLVLDRKLPARLTELSDRPEGLLANPLRRNEDVVATITTAAGPLEIVVERVNRGASGPVWLFSRKTLDAIPDVYQEVDLLKIDRFVPRFLLRPRIAGVRLFAWLVLALILPLVYRLLGAVDWVLQAFVVAWQRLRGRAVTRPAHPLPGAARLALLMVLIRWLLANLELPLPERQFWTAVASMLAIGAITWTLLLLSGVVERYVYRRLDVSGGREVPAMLRLGRRIVDVFVVAGAVLATISYFGVDATAALAGLGIGGLAIALAAQKTLENVIGGLSIIFDGAVRVGDFLKVNDTMGTVEAIGLRSTRIRTLDRTVLSVPNGQIANVNIETLSARDKFWFHHILGLRYETTSDQMREVIDGIRTWLADHPSIDQNDAIRVRFFRFGGFSLDIEIFAYVFAAGWEEFLETQQKLLLDVMGIVERSGAMMALPSQTLHLAGTGDAATAARRMSGARPAPLAAAHPEAAPAPAPEPAPRR